MLCFALRAFLPSLKSGISPALLMASSTTDSAILDVFEPTSFPVLQHHFENPLPVPWLPRKKMGLGRELDQQPSRRREVAS